MNAPRVNARHEPRPAALRALDREIVGCEACPRLVEWREQVAREKRASFRDDDYWGRPVPGFGDPHARVLIAGLAPAAHGANRTGRVFTGDRSGDFLSRRCSAPGSPTSRPSTSADDGLALRDAYISAAVRCAPPANKPTPAERDRCLPFLERELDLLDSVRVVVVLGAFAYEAVGRVLAAAGAAAPGAAPEVRPRDGGADGAGRGARLLPPVAAEHVHRASSPSRCSTRSFVRARELAGAVPSRP